MTSPARVHLGMLTPSSNTVLEPVCAAMLAGTPHVTAHFARFPVQEIALTPGALGQFSLEPMLEAAELLSHARVANVCWNGTSAAWLGLDSDRALCAAVTDRTGVRATSSVLGLVEALRASGRTRYGLVTPYAADVQARIVDTLGREGFDCAAERHAGLTTNYAFAAVDDAAIAAMLRAVAVDRPQALIVLCTNMRGMPLVAALETELGVPVYDSVGTAVWSALRLAGVSPGALAGWGALFAERAG